MSLLKSVFEPSIGVYRTTIKRSKHMHSAFYKVMRIMFVPLMERITGFYTMNDDPLSFRAALLVGSYERETTELVGQLVKPGMVVLDIGAHVGYYTKLFSQLVSNTGRVVAFEPHPLTFGTLCRNVQALGNVTPLQVAVSDQGGTASLYDCLLGPGSASLRYDERRRAWYRSHLSNHESLPRMQKGFPVASYRVKTTTVDSCLAEIGIRRVDFIKMDIEGAEMSAIRGMKQTLRLSPHLCLLMEFNPRALKSFDIDPERALAELREIGSFKVVGIEDNGQFIRLEDDDIPVHVMDGLTVNTVRVNLLCVKEA